MGVLFGTTPFLLAAGAVLCFYHNVKDLVLLRGLDIIN